MPSRGQSSPVRMIGAVALLIGVTLMLSSDPASAHHPFGEQTPGNFVEGFLSGLGHPVIGLDHLVFVVATGLLAAIQPQGLMIPIAFVVTALAGTGIHLMGLDLPAPEIVISASVVLFGGLLATKHRLNWLLVTGLGAIAGLFHGYAYGEAIVGAEPSPLVAYLSGFTLIQLAIALAAYGIAKVVTRKAAEQPALSLRFSGFAIGGAGAAFLSSGILG